MNRYVNPGKNQYPTSTPTTKPKVVYFSPFFTAPTVNKKWKTLEELKEFLRNAPDPGEDVHKYDVLGPF